jgi:hypothetical protein
MLNQKILNSVGRQNYEQYMLITEGKEIDSILDSHSPIFELYKYRDKLFNEGIGQDIDIDKLEYNLQNNKDNELRLQLQDLFLDYISDNEFKIIKNMLINHIFGWNIKRLVEIHNKYKGYRIFRILSIQYNDWLN